MRTPISRQADISYLNGNGGVIWPEKGIPAELSLELLPVLAVDQLKHRLVHHVRLKQENVFSGVELTLNWT